MKKTLTDIDGALTAQHVDARPPLIKTTIATFCIYRRQDGKLRMGNKVVQIDGDKSTLLVDGVEYKFTSRSFSADR